MSRINGQDVLFIAKVPRGKVNWGDYKKYFSICEPKNINTIQDNGKLNLFKENKIRILAQMGIEVNEEGKKIIMDCKTVEDVDNFGKSLMKAYWESI